MKRAMKKTKKKGLDKEHKKEFNKAWKDSQELGLGIFDQETKKRINPETLAFITPSGKEDKLLPRKEVQLRRDLMLIEKIYNEKFKKCTNPYCLELFKKDPALFVERMVRAVEICTMNHVLNKGGTLNYNKRASLVKGRRTFLWEY